MAKLPVSSEQLIADFGPHKNYPPREGFPGRDEPDEVVKTHCCFCGMQCGIKLLVKNNRVVGFDPWERLVDHLVARADAAAAVESTAP